MNKTKVLVFTCSEKKDGLSERALDTVLTDVWEQAYPCKSSPIVKCEFSNSGTALLNVDINNLAKEEGVFLIYDGVEPKKPFLDELKKQCEGDDLYVLVHTHGPDLDDFRDWTLSGLLPGSHTGLPEDHYSPLFEILTDDQPDKPNRIINTIFKPYNKLETILQFLHGCLVPNNQDGSFVSAYKKLRGDNNIKSIVEDFYENIYPNQTNNYIEGLAKLRNTLLKFALTQNQTL